MEEKTYQYWFFFIRPDYLEKLQVVSVPKENYLYAYTDKKKYAKRFMELHLDKAFVKKKMELSREEVNDLARRYQNYIIREMNISTKDPDGQPTTIKLCMTENEHMTSESRCYAELDSIWKIIWDGYDKLQYKYRRSLDTLEFSKLCDRLSNGETHFPPMDADILGSFIYIFKPVLEG